MRRIGLLALGLVVGCSGPGSVPSRTQVVVLKERIHRSHNPVFVGALNQLVSPAVYDAGYQSISYPGGDVPANRGACADVVVRALRSAGLDLQFEIYNDALSGAYRGIRSRDKNIDHRRVVNQEVYCRRHMETLTTKADPLHANEWLPGDIVTWRLPGNRPHTGIISDLRRGDGLPLVIHNVSVVREEDVLTAWAISGHYRFVAKSVSGGRPT